MKGRTTRMVLRALIDLSEGKDVVIVGFTTEQAKSIAARVVKIASGLGIPCRNIPAQRTADAPLVTFHGYDAVVPFPTTKARVFIDHRAAFDKGNVAPPAERSVFA